jgi:hypothetical protein
VSVYVLSKGLLFFEKNDGSKYKSLYIYTLFAKLTLPSGNQTWLAGKATSNSSMMFPVVNLPDTSGIFQPDTFDYQRV